MGSTATTSPTTGRRLRIFIAVGALIASALTTIGVITAPPAFACGGADDSCGAAFMDATFLSDNDTSTTTFTYGHDIIASGHVFDDSVVCFASGFSACDSPTGAIWLFNGTQQIGQPNELTPASVHAGPARSDWRAPDFSGLPAGTHSITAIYVPGNFNTTQRTQEITVAPAGTTTQLQVGPSTSVAGQPVTLTATVHDVGGIVLNHGAHLPTGTVDFFRGLNVIGSATLNGDTATFTTSALPGGDSTFTAQYAGDDGYAFSTSSTATHVVNKGTTSSALTQTVNPTVYGETFTLTDTVSAVAPAIGSPTGQVQFFRDATPIAGQALTGGVASTSPVLVPGTYALSAAYAGDANFNPSTSNTLSHTVHKAGTTSSANIAPASATNLGDAVHIHSDVTVNSPGGGTPTGTVQFRDGTTNLGGPQALTPTGATLITSALGGGTHSISAVYSGDANFTASTSAPNSHSVLCTTTVSGTVNGTYNVPAAGTTCISGATITGGVNIPAGAKVSIVNSTIGGYLQATNAAGTITICGSTIPGITINNAAGAVTIGDPYAAACAGNVISGGISLASNHGGVRVSGNRVGSGLNATSNNGGATVIGGNTITGWLQCSGNTSVTNEGRPNTAGGRTGQCAIPANF